jgi:hypothetical protein
LATGFERDAIVNVGWSRLLVYSAIAVSNIRDRSDRVSFMKDVIQEERSMRSPQKCHLRVTCPEGANLERNPPGLKRGPGASICARSALDNQLLTGLQPFSLFDREWRAGYLHPANLSCGNQLGDIGDSKVLSLNRREKIFESARTAWSNDDCEVNGPFIDGLPGMGNARRKRDNVSRMQDPATVRTPNRNCALKDLKDFVLNIMQVTRRPETGRRTVIEYAKAVIRVEAERPYAGHFAPGGNCEFAQILSPAYYGGSKSLRHARDCIHQG